MNGATNNKLIGVQAARGIAALLVVFFHCSAVIGLPEYGGVQPFDSFFAFGHAGVDFFFVLSGFIIFYIHYSDINKPKKLAEFVFKRTTRIFPLYLLVMVFYTAKVLINGTFDWTVFLKSLFLLPQATPPFILQSWTLTHEIFFYTIFGMAIINLKFARVAIFVWLISSIYSWNFDINITPGLFSDFFSVATSPYNILFLIGIFVAWFTSRTNITFPRSTALLGAVLFIITGLSENHHLIQNGSLETICLFGLSAGIMLLGLVSSEANYGINIGKFGAILGDVSYPLYLIHGAVISVVMSTKMATEFQGQSWLIFFIVALIAFSVALLINRKFEQPVALALRKFRQAKLTNII